MPEPLRAKNWIIFKGNIIVTAKMGYDSAYIKTFLDTLMVQSPADEYMAAPFAIETKEIIKVKKEE